MKISENGLKKLTEWEGKRNHVYLDSARLPTIGVGHLLTRSELTSGKIHGVRYVDGITDEQINLLLVEDLKPAEIILKDFVMTKLNQNQYDALVSFVFNVGITAFYNSTLLRKLNEHKLEEVPRQLMRWKYAGGRIAQGLINRRRNEVELFIS